MVIAAGCSDAWSHASVDFSMTLTKSACSRFGHWLTSEGRFLDVRDYAMLQGFDPDKLDFAGAKIAPRAAASMLGNAMSLNVVESVLPHLLYSAGWLTDSEFAAMTKSVQQRWLSMQCPFFARCQKKAARHRDLLNSCICIYIYMCTHTNTHTCIPTCIHVYLPHILHVYTLSNTPYRYVYIYT